MVDNWWQNLMTAHPLMPWIIAAAIVVGVIADRLIMKHISQLSSRTLLPHIVSRLRKPLAALVVLIVASIAMNSFAMPDDATTRGVRHAIGIGFILLGGWAALAIIDAARARMLKGYDISHADNFVARKMHTRISLFYRLGSFLVVLVTIALVLMTFDAVTNVGKSLLASAGVAGVIIGFAAQKTLASIIAGIQIAISQPIRIEDAVVVEGEWGWVEEITLTYVVIRIWDKRRLIVPITYFIEKPFQNWTRKDAEIIGSVIIHTDYSVPMEAMRRELDRLLDLTPLWNHNIKVLQVVDTTPREVQLRALMTGRDSPTTWDLRCFVREGLIKWLQENYPHALPHTRMHLEGEYPLSQNNAENLRDGHQTVTN